MNIPTTYSCLQLLEMQPWAAPLLHLYNNWAQPSSLPEPTVELLPLSGSDRRYVRFWQNKQVAALGAFNPNKRENEAFVRLSAYFKTQGVRVPNIYSYAPPIGVYLLEDLGGDTLLDVVQRERMPDGNLSQATVQLYRNALEQLAFMQTKAAEQLPDDYLLSPTRFDEMVMAWDLNYFKYCFLLPSKVQYDEYLLQQDFESLIAFLAKAPKHYFLFRDFQARNILIRNQETFFIDFQGGKRGALAYDVASLLVQAKAQIPIDTQIVLLDFYISEVQKWIELDETTFRQQYEGFSLLRYLQVLGAYGAKGYGERKPHFLESIPLALQNIRQWLEIPTMLPPLPHLRNVLHQLVLQTPAPIHPIRIFSFSYRLQPTLPTDKQKAVITDCRTLPDPHDIPALAPLTGVDEGVRSFLLAIPSVQTFLQEVYAVVEQNIRLSIQQSKTIPSFYFGCVGGQHRSVFVAQCVADFIRRQCFHLAPFQLSVQHLAQPQLK